MLRSGFGAAFSNAFGMVQRRNAAALKPMLLEDVRQRQRRGCVRFPLVSTDVGMVRQVL